MTPEQIAALPVAHWADKDCQCWLWTTNSHLHDAFHILEAWGFKYITTVTWVKTQFGLGYWLRGQTEHLLLGIKGHPRNRMTGPHGTIGSSHSTVIFAPKGKHSEKPQAAIDLIEALGEPPRLELFARTKRLGWDAWGNQLGIKL